jgi:hypothetical protein
MCRTSDVFPHVCYCATVSLMLCIPFLSVGVTPSVTGVHGLFPSYVTAELAVQAQRSQDGVGCDGLTGDGVLQGSGLVSLVQRGMIVLVSKIVRVQSHASMSRPCTRFRRKQTLTAKRQCSGCHKIEAVIPPVMVSHRT